MQSGKNIIRYFEVYWTRGMHDLYDEIEVCSGYLGGYDRRYNDLNEKLLAIDSQLAAPVDFQRLYFYGGKAPQIYDILFVDIDGLGGINKVFDQLCELRENIQNLPIILLSSEFQKDDFDMHRITLGDASLRTPVLQGSLEFALYQSVINNDIWNNAKLNTRQSKPG